MTKVLFILLSLISTLSFAADASKHPELERFEGRYEKQSGCTRVPDQLIVRLEGESLVITMNENDPYTTTRGDTILEWRDSFAVAKINAGPESKTEWTDIGIPMRTTKEITLGQTAKGWDLRGQTKSDLFSAPYYSIHELALLNDFQLSYASYEGDKKAFCEGQYVRIRE